MKRTAVRFVWICVIAVAAWLALLAGARPALAQAAPQETPVPPAAPAAVDAGPDLVAEVNLVPNPPLLNETTTVQVIVRNIGTATAAPVVGEIYIDPASPPTAGTAGFPVVNVPSLGPGASAQGSRNHTFTSEGEHTIYVWVDRAGVVVEGNEANNLLTVPVFIGDCTVDAFEVDNTCAAAGWMSEQTTQARSFCTQGTLARVDEDWVKFTAFAGVQYSLATSNRGAHAAPGVSIYNACNSAPIVGPSANAATWTPAASGVYYAKVHNPTDLGPDTGYDLTLTSNSGVTDNFEPDNTCATARDITTDGVKQTQRRFVTAGDQDWVNFTLAAGQSYTVIADNLGAQTSPLIDLFTACADVPAGLPAGGAPSPVPGNSPTAQTLYARIRNSNSASFGPDRTYDLRVVVSNCTNDGFEADNTAGQAKALAVNATQPGRTFCPGGDQDWVRLTTTPGKIYVLQTGGLGAASDTVITLFAADGTTAVADGSNDDYGFGKASRVVWTASAATYLARVTHHSAVASGPETSYDLTLREGFCLPDALEAQADNGPGDAEPLAANGALVAHNLCADPLNPGLADQDWHRFNGVAGGKYQVKIEGVGPNADPVVTLFDATGATALAANDDAGLGRAATLLYTATSASAYYVRVTQFNPAINGNGTDYSVKLLANEPPPPTPSPTPTPIPPTPTPTPNPVNVKTVILVNRDRMQALYGAGETNTLMTKLFALANHARVQGAVVEVENDPAVAAAYATWTANAASLADNSKANAVTSAVRGRLMTFLDSAPNVKYVVIVGGDQAIPFRRVLDLVPPQTGPKPDAALEPTYALELTPNTTVAAALAAAMILTDDYYVDKVPGTWEDKDKNTHELYIPDLPSGRLIETPAEIRAFIDQYLAGQSILASRAIVTGWDFVTDSAQVIATTLGTDGAATDATLITSNANPSWPRAEFIAHHLNFTEKVFLHSINGHSTHTDTLLPKLQGAEQPPVTAAEVAAATGDLAGTVIYNVGCHGGLNEPGELDLAQAYVREKAHYIGNTGFGWGGNAISYSEDLMRRFTVRLMVGTSNEIGPALVAGKQWYKQLRAKPNAYDAKVLMQVTLYGLPMYEVQSSGTFDEGDPFPSVPEDVTPPSAFSGGPATGKVSYSFGGAFGETPDPGGVAYNLDGTIDFSAGEPVQPLYYVNAGGAFNDVVGDLRGALFTGGEYEDKPNFDPVVALAYNEYTATATEPPIDGSGWLPAAPFSVPGVRNAPGAGQQNVVMSLGQFSADDATERLYSSMTFDTLYSFSADAATPTVHYIDGTLDPAAGKGRIKVEASDDSGVSRVVVAFTQGTGTWQSVDLEFSPASQKWTGEITATVTTRYFVQVADGAGNVQVETNKGAYYRLPAPLPLAAGQPISIKIFLPAVAKP